MLGDRTFRELLDEQLTPEDVHEVLEALDQ